MPGNQELPLNGRNFTDLTFLVPGVSQTGQGDTGSPFAIGGARNDNTNFLIDGVSARRPQFGDFGVSPNLDAIQEFKVSTSSYSAEYGQFSGGVISVALKSGSNQFHGALFEYLRNDKLDARNFFSAGVPELRRNQFGGLLSGPVLVPKLYNGHDRTFFLFSWESYRDATGNTGVAVVPTPLARSGDFSQTMEAGGQRAQIRNPFGTGYFPGNVIPPSLINPVAAKIVPYWPMPNLPGQTNNYRAEASGHSPWDSYVTRIDERLSSKDTLAVRYQRRPNHVDVPFDASTLGIFGSTTDNLQEIGGLNYVRVFTPAVVNEFRAGLYRMTSLQLSMDAGTDYTSQWGISGVGSSMPLLQGSPQINVVGMGLVGDNPQRPFTETVNDFSYSDTLTWVKGAHQLKFGGNLLRNQLFQPYYLNVRGSFTFNGTWTGDSFADFLLGLLNSASRQTQTPQNYMFSTNFGLFAQDDYKVTPRLTLNLGLRWDYNGMQYDKYGRYSGFIPEYGRIIVVDAKGVPNFQQLVAGIGATNIMGLAKDYGVPKTLVFPRYLNMAPRFGLAWRPFGGTRTVVRGGYGVFFGTSFNNPLTLNLANVFPFAISQGVNRVAGNPYAISFASPFAGANVAAALTVGGVQLHPSTPYQQSWNLTVERQLSSSVALEISYNGSKGTHLGLSSDLNRPYYGPQYLLPGGSFLRPYPQLNTTITYYDSAGNSIYNAGMITIRRRFARGFFFSVSYVYSKSIDDGSTIQGGGNAGLHQMEDPRNVRLEWGRSNFDTPHAFTVSYSYAIPYRGTARVGWMLRGWQLAGSGQAHTGQPFTPSLSNVNLGLGGSLRPDRIAKGTLSRPTVQEWFDANAFPMLPNNVFRMGTSGRNILDAPGLVALNFSLSKNARIRERQIVQFRWEVFNATNHPNFALPVFTMNTVNAGTITQASAPRQMQFGLRYQF